MCEVYQERKIQDVNLNRKTIFNCEEKQYISKQKCKVNPGIVIWRIFDLKTSNDVIRYK